jgi:SAM-dependent methyltransferase
MTEVIEQRLLALRQQGVFPRVSTMLADVCTLDLPAESFDAVLCHQAIEHVRDLERMFRVVSRALRRGGRGVFTNDSNVYHPSTRRWTEEMWALRDGSAEYTDKLKQERPIENEDIEPYAVMRRRIIAQRRPDLHDGLESLTAATAGMDQSEIEALCSGYKPGDRLPTPPALSRCRNPVTGEYCERLLDPFEVAAMARRAGLRAWVYPHRFNRFPLTVLNLLDPVPFRWLKRAFFRLKPQFVVVVEKSLNT